MKSQWQNSPPLIAFLVSALLGACTKEPPPAPRLVPVVTAKAQICDVPLYYDYVGHVEAYNTVQIVPQVQGFLTNTLFLDGQEVKNGDLLATIDVRPYKADLAKAEATLAQNIALLKYSKEAVERYSKLVQDEFVSQIDFDNYITTVLSNEAVIKQNLAEIENAKLNVEYCYLRAPMDSVAGTQLIDVGNFIPAGSQNPIVILNQIKPIFAYFYIPENDLSRIRKLQGENPLQIRLYLEGDDIQGHDGMLTAINNQVDENTGSILLEGTLPNDDKALWPGQFSSIRLFLEELKNVVVVPAQAVQEGQDGTYVFIIKDDATAEQRNVIKGEKIDDRVVITSGLSGSETVVLEGQLNLTTGTKVKISNQKMTVPTFDRGLKAP